MELWKAASEDFLSRKTVLKNYSLLVFLFSSSSITEYSFYKGSMMGLSVTFIGMTSQPHSTISRSYFLVYNRYFYSQKSTLIKLTSTCHLTSLYETRVCVSPEYDLPWDKSGSRVETHVLQEVCCRSEG
jgi:hypothetical protein